MVWAQESAWAYAFLAEGVCVSPLERANLGAVEVFWSLSELFV